MPIDGLQFDVVDSDTKKEPTPGQATPRRRGRPPGSGTKNASHAQMRDEITAALKFGALLWSTKDQHCAPILSSISADIADDLAKFAGKSKWARKWVAKTTDLSDVFSFFIKVKPLIDAINEHHIAPAIAARNESRQEQQPEEEPAYAGYGVVG